MKKPPKELVEDFYKWYRNDPHSTNEDYYADIITKDSLSQLSRGEFVEFFFQFACDGGKVQSGGHRTAPRFRKTLEEKYEEFWAFALEPFQEDFNEINWLEKIEQFKGIGQGLATIYLNRVDKKRFAVLNNKAIEAIKLLDVDVPAILVGRYKAVRDAERQLIEWFPEFDNFCRTDALTQFLIGEDDGKAWADKLRKADIEGEPRYWIIAPGRAAEFWDECREEGVIRVGWNELNEDLSRFSSEVKLRERHWQIYENVGDFKGINDFVNVMKPGDRLFVKHGVHELIGYGEVDSDYRFNRELPTYRHMRLVRWGKPGNWPLREGMRQLPRKTLTPVDDPGRIKELLEIVAGKEDPDPMIHDAIAVYPPSQVFSEKTFEHLRGLHESPTTTFYNERVEDFRLYVEEPFRKLMKSIAQHLPKNVTDFMETEKRLFSRIPKNDYGRGGAWDFYWGAFYPRGFLP